MGRRQDPLTCPSDGFAFSSIVGANTCPHIVYSRGSLKISLSYRGDYKSRFCGFGNMLYQPMRFDAHSQNVHRAESVQRHRMSVRQHLGMVLGAGNYTYIC